MDINNFRLFVMDMEKVLLSQTGRPFVRMQIESGMQYILDNADTIVAQMSAKGWVVDKAGYNPPKNAL